MTCVLPTTESIRNMVDRAVVSIYTPHFADRGKIVSNSIPGRRLDVDCMSVVIMVLRLMYRLDDSFEM